MHCRWEWIISAAAVVGVLWSLPRCQGPRGQRSDLRRLRSSESICDEDVSSLMSVQLLQRDRFISKVKAAHAEAHLAVDGHEDNGEVDIGYGNSSNSSSDNGYGDFNDGYGHYNNGSGQDNIGYGNSSNSSSDATTTHSATTSHNATTTGYGHDDIRSEEHTSELQSP